MTAQACRFRLLYVIDSLRVAGAERSLAEITPLLVDRGVEVHVAYLRDRQALAGELRAAGAALHPIALDESRLRQIVALSSLAKGLKPDLVHTTLFDADIVGRLACWRPRTPLVTTWAGESHSPVSGGRRTRQVKQRAARWLDAATMKRVAAVHAVSESTAVVMSERLAVPRTLVNVIHRGRGGVRLGSVDAARKARSRTALGIADNACIVVSAGRHEMVKGLDVLIGAAPAVCTALPGTRFLIAGERGAATDELVALIERSGLHDTVELLGQRGDIPDLIAAADVVAVPSRSEGLPGVVVEAMALGVPVVASDLPGVRSVVDGDGAVDFVPIDDSAALAAALLGAIGDPHRRQRALDAATRVRERFDPAVAADRMIEWYERVIGTSPSQSRGCQGSRR